LIPGSGFYCVLDARDSPTQRDFALRYPRQQCLSLAGKRIAFWENERQDAQFKTDQTGHCVAFHGVLYNRGALTRQLDLAASTPTGQLLLKAGATWPSDWTDRLDGLYVLAHWTGDGRDLTLRRDASGALGLFYARTASGGIAFSSHLDTLVRLPGVSRRLSRPALHEYLRLLDIAAPNTIYEGVRAVPPGEAVVLDALRPGVETALPPRAFPEVVMPFDDAVTELESRLAASVSRRLAGTERPAAFLSGGVDSSLICALASRERPDLQALTVGFDGNAYDETPVAQAIASHLGMRHRVLRFSREAFVGAVAKAGLHAEQPMADPAEPATLLAFEQVRQDHDTVLDGTGADEQVGAMPPRHVRVAVEHAARLPAALRRWLAATLPRLPGLAGYAPLFDFEHPAETMMRWHGFRRQEIEALCGEPVSLAHTRFYDVFARFPRDAHYARYSALMEALPCDRLSQAALVTGLDVRFPFWDPEVEAWLRGQPLAHRWREDAPKHILRALLARHVPRQLWDLPKHSFNFPLLEFLSAEDHRVVRRYLLDDRWERWQVLAAERVADYARRFIAGERGVGFRVWALVVLAAWLEGHFD
jgi:asparagine synthase (glutamine-hydrolysing)